MLSLIQKIRVGIILYFSLFCDKSCTNDKMNHKINHKISYLSEALNTAGAPEFEIWIDLSEFSRRKKLCYPDLKSMLTSEKALKSGNGIRYSRERIYNSNSHIRSKNVNKMTHSMSPCFFKSTETKIWRRKCQMLNVKMSPCFFKSMRHLTFSAPN